MTLLNSQLIEIFTWFKMRIYIFLKSLRLSQNYNVTRLIFMSWFYLHVKLRATPGFVSKKINRVGRDLLQIVRGKCIMYIVSKSQHPSKVHI